MELVYQAQGVIMERLQVDASEALHWLVRSARQRRSPIERVAAEVVDRLDVTGPLQTP